MAIIVAVFLVCMLVLAALVLDLGTGYDHDADIQAAADAGALAGCQQLIYDAGQAASFTQQYVMQNVSPADSASNVEGGNLAFTQLDVGARSVAVSLRESHVPFNFAQIIGRKEGTVTAHAKAELMYLTGIPMSSPVAIPYLHPDHFVIQYSRSGFLNGPTMNLGESGAGTYSGSRSVSLGSGFYLASLTAVDANGKEMMAPIVVGSLYVAGGDPAIKAVDLDRSGIGGSESLHIRITTEGVTDETVQVSVGSGWGWGGGHPVDLADPDLDGVYEGSTTVAPTSYSNGVAMVYVRTRASSTPGSAWPANRSLGMYAIFRPGQTIDAVYQNTYGTRGGVGLSCTVKTRTMDFGGAITVSSNDPMFDSTFGVNGWVDMLGGASFDQEVKVALGDLQVDPGWSLLPDVGPGGNHNGTDDIGEYVPVSANIRSGGGFAGSLQQAVGRPMVVALVSTGYNDIWDWSWLPGEISWWRSWLSNWWSGRHPPTGLPILEFGALQIDSVVPQGNSDFTLSGHFVRWLSTGKWTSEKPKGLYVETAVLTE